MINCGVCDQKQFSRLLVSNLFLHVQSDDCIPADWNFRLRLAPCHFIELDAFQHHPSKENLFSAHAILTEAMQDAGIVASDHLPQLSNLERLGITMETTMQVCLLLFSLVNLGWCLTFIGVLTGIHIVVGIVMSLM